MWCNRKLNNLQKFYRNRTLNRTKKIVHNKKRTDKEEKFESLKEKKILSENIIEKCSR